MINHNPMATKIIEKNVVRQPKFSIIFAPRAKPTTDPAANIELNTPTPIASFSLGNWSRIIPNAMGNIEIPIPWITLATIRNVN
jgi:hypothetical protein